MLSSSFAGQRIDIAEVVAALGRAQARFPAVDPNHTAEVRSRREGVAPYTYKYADLASIMAAVREPLAKEGLTVTQITDGMTLRTFLFHTSGQYLANETPIIARDGDAQSLGSGISYARRYGFTSLIGLAVNAEDDDGKNARNEAASRGGSFHERMERRRAPPPSDVAAHETTSAPQRAQGSADDPVPFGKYAKPPHGPKTWRWVAWNDPGYIALLHTNAKDEELRARCEKLLIYAEKHGRYARDGGAPDASEPSEPIKDPAAPEAAPEAKSEADKAWDSGHPGASDEQIEAAAAAAAAAAAKLEQVGEKVPEEDPASDFR